MQIMSNRPSMKPARKFQNLRQVKKNAEASYKRLEEKGKPKPIKFHADLVTKNINVCKEDVLEYHKETGEFPNALFSPNFLHVSTVSMVVLGKVVGLKCIQTDKVSRLTLGQV